MPIDTAAKRFSAINHGCVWRGANVVPDGSIDRAAALYLYSGIGASPPVLVPDVVGLAAAAAVAALGADGFVAFIVDAFDPVVPVGIIISQNPIAGSLAPFGSTVTIVRSLGPAPVPPVPEGGGTVGGDGDDHRKRKPAESRPTPDQEAQAERLNQQQQDLANQRALEQQLARNRVVPDTVDAQPPQILLSKQRKSRATAARATDSAAQLRRADEIEAALAQLQAQESADLERQQAQETAALAERQRQQETARSEAERQQLEAIARASDIALDDQEAMDALRVLWAAGLL